MDRCACRTSVEKRSTYLQEIVEVFPHFHLRVNYGVRLARVGEAHACFLGAELGWSVGDLK